MVLGEVKQDELNQIFDGNSKNVLNYLLQRTVLSYPEFLPSQNNTELYLEKKQCEQWIVQALGLKPLGAGSYPIDGINNKNGYDVSSLALAQSSNGEMASQTGEKSLGQKFDDENFGENEETLDSLYATRSGDKIINSWKKILKKKWKQTIDDHELSNLYLVNLILYKPKKKLYIFLLKVNYEKLEEISKDKMTTKSVFVKNFIDSKIGNVKIYKSKKRMELRIKPKELIKNKSYLSFNINSKTSSKNLRDIFDDNKKLKEYCEKEIKKYKEFFDNLKN